MTAADPAVSVIIPTRNRSTLLRASLAGLARQSLDQAAFEVIVVDDGSTDETPRDLGEQSTPFRLRTIRTSGVGAGAARNRGAALGKAGVLLFLDDDVEPAAEFVAEHLAAHDAPSVVALGRIETRLRRGAGGLERHLAAWWLQHDERMLNSAGRPDWADCYGGNLSIEREAFLSIGGFAEDLARSEDVELGYRLHLVGHRFVFLERAAARQMIDKPFRKLLQDAESAGEVGPELCRRHPAMLARLELGRFGQAPRRAGVVRRVLLRTGLPDPIVALVDRVPLPNALNGRWNSFLTNLAYWRGVQRGLMASGDVESWRRLTTQSVGLNVGGGPAPRIAVVVPTMGRGAALERCLRGLRDGSRLPDDVVVIDQSDGSTIDAGVRALGTDWTNLRRIASPSRGVSHARNLGWRATTCSIVAFTDDDCVPDQGWLAALERAFHDDTTLDATTGRVLGLDPETAGYHAVSSRSDTRRRTYAGRSLPWRIGTGGNLAVRREALERVRGFDPRLGPGSPGEAAEDLDLIYRLLVARSRIRYEPRALVYHELQSTDRRRLTRTRYGHGLGAFAGVTLRRGDLFGAVILAAWIAARLRLLAGATLRSRRPHAADRALDERLLLRGVADGLAQGLLHGSSRDPEWGGSS